MMMMMMMIKCWLAMMMMALLGEVANDDDYDEGDQLIGN